MHYIKIFRLLTVAITLLISANLWADIGIENVKHSRPGQNNGSITVTLGDAGPFHIVVERLSPSEIVHEVEFFDGDSYTTPEDLTPGEYIIKVTSFADASNKEGGCENILMATVDEYRCDISIQVLEQKSIS